MVRGRRLPLHGDRPAPDLGMVTEKFILSLKCVFKLFSGRFIGQLAVVGLVKQGFPSIKVLGEYLIDINSQFKCKFTI